MIKELLISIQIKRVYWLYLAAALIYILLYFKIYNSAANDDRQEVFRNDYFVNTSGCHMPALRPFSKSALLHVQRLKRFNCSKMKLFDAQTIEGKNYLVLSKKKREIKRKFKVDKISDIQCEYKTIKRFTDNKNHYSKTKRFRLENRKRQIEVKNGSRILRVSCFGHENKTSYHDVHFFLPLPPDKPSTSLGERRLSVMILGIDSISHMQFLRRMPLLGEYIKNLPHVEFWGYNRVGRNSYPNLMPFFSGLNETELEADCYNTSQNFDNCQLLFRHFKAFGYNTSFGEDTCIGGTFNYLKGGFRQIPTDFYLRPVMVEINAHTTYSTKKKVKINCSGSRKYADILYEFIHKLVPHLKQGPHFSFFWQTQGVHDYFDYAHLVDKEYLKLLTMLRSNRVLGNTLILLMADHGLRYGSFRSTYQGMIEESQPLLIAIFPTWLEKSYPLALANLRRNAHSLITTFDLHVTLKDLTNLKLLGSNNIEKRSKVLEELGDKMPRGISLFLPIPETRNCHLANIPAQYCLCHKLHQIPSTDYRSNRAARFMVETINKLISNYTLCQRLKLEEVQDTYLLKRDTEENVFGVKVRLKTTPGKGFFEGTAVFLGESLALNGPILRINKYGNQSYCIQNYKIEMYCYCE